ncbi:MAG: FAD/NAD(P)-binding protein, partial [Brachybacterium sp.]|nr:FAD/NAD(P)-binding protein [Brachybacterium sp.]
MAERAPGTTPDPVRLLVVGAGAKALFALEELASRWREGTGPRMEFTVVDPGEHLGTGAAYHPFQPHPLRLNVGSGLLAAPAPGAV